MSIVDYLKSAFCLMDLQSLTKESAIRELVTLLAGSQKIIDSEKFNRIFRSSSRSSLY
jgi:mannitol/fructose-specific phosphotransferase system IIA component (Ntr-type)